MADKSNIKQRTTADEVREKIQLTKSKKQFDNKMGDIWNLIIDMRKKNEQQEGEKQDINENSLYRVLCSYYEMGLKMQEAIETMTAIQTALQCVTSAIGVMDDIINIFSGSLESIYQNDQGLFARFKAKRQVKKAQRSIVNRLNMITSYMTGMSTMADSITESMDGAFRKMDGRSAKNKKKQSKKSGGNGSAAAANNFPRTEKLIDDYMKSNGYETSSNSGSGTDSGNGGSGWDAN